MSRNLKASLALFVASLAVVALIVALTRKGEETVPEKSGDDAASGRVVRPDSQRLSTAASGDTTFVEFLDFECEACGAAYPSVEELRQEYGDRVTFVVRYFPLHTNSEAAAKAAEGAAAQGKFEEMYQMLFENQAEWAERNSPQDDVFFGYAEQLGLDMDQFRTTYDDPATLAKIQRDKADGLAAGVTGTPTFFLDGKIVHAANFEGIASQIDASLTD
jgi:protein-disulfide isomerase